MFKHTYTGYNLPHFLEAIRIGEDKPEGCSKLMNLIDNEFSRTIICSKFAATIIH